MTPELIEPGPARRLRVLVAGSRTFTDRGLLFQELDERREKILEVVAGECPEGADKFGKEWAQERGVPYRGFPADWKTHGKRAGYVRNLAMAEYVAQQNGPGGAALIFWDGISKGTSMMLNLLEIRVPAHRVVLVLFVPKGVAQPPEEIP